MFILFSSITQGLLQYLFKYIYQSVLAKATFNTGQYEIYLYSMNCLTENGGIPYQRLKLQKMFSQMLFGTEQDIR